MDSSGDSWNLPIIFEIITALCFLYICKYPLGANVAGETVCSGSSVAKTLLVAFAVLCPLVHGFLLPVRLLMEKVEGWLKTPKSADALPHSIFTPDMKYNAIATCAVATCVFAAYMALLQHYDKCARAMGQVHLRLDKDHENHVSFAEPDEGCVTTTAGCSAKRCAAMYGAALVGCVVALPMLAQNTFAYTFVERGWLRITSDHLWISATVLFATVMARRVWFNFNHFPAGYCKGLYAASQFTIGYGSIISVSAATFLAFAADVMVTYTYKLMRLQQMRALQPLAQAENVTLGPHSNAMTSRFADYLVDCALAALDPGMGDTATMAMLRLLAIYYRGVFLHCVDILLFGCLVFAPMAMVLLVSIHRRI